MSNQQTMYKYMFKVYSRNKRKTNFLLERKDGKMQQISCAFNMLTDQVHSLEKLWKIHSQDVLKYGRMFELIKNYRCVVYNTGKLEISISPRKKC